MHLKTLAEEHGVSHSVLHTVYMHQREKQLSKPITTRFTPEDDSGDITLKDVQNMLRETRVSELLIPSQGVIGSQLKSLSLIVHYLRIRVNGLSQPYDTQITQSHQIMQKLPIDLLPSVPRLGLRWLADSDGMNAGEAYWSGTNGISLHEASKDFLITMLLYTYKELRGIHDFCKPKAWRHCWSKIDPERYLDRCCVILAHTSEIGFEALRCAYNRQRIGNTVRFGANSRRMYYEEDSLLNHAKAYAIVDELQVQALRPRRSPIYRDSPMFKALPFQGYDVAQVTRQNVALSYIVDKNEPQQGQGKTRIKTGRPVGKRTGNTRDQPLGPKAMEKFVRGRKRKRQACPCCSHDCDDPKTLRDHLRSSPDCHRYCGPDHDPDPPEDTIDDYCPGSSKIGGGESDTDDDEKE